MNIYFYSYDFKGWGRFVIAQENDCITAVSFLPPCCFSDYTEQETELIKKAECQLGEYFTGARKMFELPLAAKGTEFQQKVWTELEKIPYGSSKSYAEIARCLGNSRAARAVGGACNKNPIAIIVPCHRVVGANGSLTGYAGGLDMKRKLLELECVN